MLDDSTDEVTKKLIDKRAFEWTERGVNVQVVRRNNRAGYKAGAMKDVSLSRLCHTGIIPLSRLLI